MASNSEVMTHSPWSSVVFMSLLGKSMETCITIARDPIIQLNRPPLHLSRWWLWWEWTLPVSDSSQENLCSLVERWRTLGWRPNSLGRGVQISAREGQADGQTAWGESKNQTEGEPKITKSVSSFVICRNVDGAFVGEH